MTCPEGDIVDTLIRELRAMLPQKPVVELRRFEFQLRAEFGGRRYYFKKNSTVERERAKPRQR